MTIIKIPFLAVYLKLHRKLSIKLLKLSKTTKILSFCEHLTVNIPQHKVHLVRGTISHT